MTPLVSVCIPAFDAERFVGATIASVLSQTLDDFEVVVVDDHSSDDTAEVVAGFDDPRVRLLRNQRNIGAIPNWNRARNEARGEFVKMLSDDDILYRHCLERQVGDLRRHPRAAMAAGRRDVIDENGRLLVRNRGLAGLDGPVSGFSAIRRTVRAGTNLFGEPGFGLVRRDVLERCPPFDNAFPYAVDLHLWCEVLQRGDLVAAVESMGAFRVHLKSESVRLGTDQSRQVRALYGHLRQNLPGVVRTTDVAVGSIRARILELMRRTLYKRMQRRAVASEAFS